MQQGDFHIEHFKPKGKFPQDQLEYTNLHACCRAQPKGGPDEYCGHRKGEVFDSRLVSPLEEDCGSFFTYDMVGGIRGVGERGTVTIDILNLNSSLLRRSRKNLIEYFEDLEEEERQLELARHLREENGILGEYHTLISYLQESGLI